MQNHEKLDKSLIRIALILVLGAIAPMLDSTMVNIAINKLSHNFHTSLNTIQWVITGFVLAMGVAVPIAGWLINRFSGKKVMNIVVAIFGLTSLLAGLSWNVGSFIAFRVLQGASTGIIMTILMTLLAKIAGRDKIGRLMAIIMIPVTLGPIFGPIIGGFLVQYAGWRWIFFVNVPVVLLAVLLQVRFLPDFEPFDRQAKIDAIGIVLLAAMSTSIIYGITKASESASLMNKDMLLYTGIGIALFIVYATYNTLRHNKTVLPLKLFRIRSYSASTLGQFLMGIVIYGPMLLLPLYFQNILGYSVINTALALIPQSVGTLIARPYIGKMVDRIGAKWVTIVSLLISLIGTLPLILVDANTSLVLLAIILFVRGIGVGGISMPLMSDAYSGVNPTDIPQASVGTEFIQNLGGSFGPAVIATVVASVFLHSHLLLNGYHAGFAVACIVLVVMMPVALFLSSTKQEV